MCCMPSRRLRRLDATLVPAKLPLCTYLSDQLQRWGVSGTQTCRGRLAQLQSSVSAPCWRVTLTFDLLLWLTSRWMVTLTCYYGLLLHDNLNNREPYKLIFTNNGTRTSVQNTFHAVSVTTMQKSAYKGQLSPPWCESSWVGSHQLRSLPTAAPSAWWH